MREQLMMWETEVREISPGHAEVVAKKPLCRMTMSQAARLLGCSTWTVSRLYRDGLLSGWKPGAGRGRADGKGSNAKVILDAESVLKYKQAVTDRGAF
jgi:excisionase family DNA binding protein